MTRALAVLALLVAAAAGAQADTRRIEVLALDPPDGSVLRVAESLHVRIAYAADQPVRFRVRGFLNGTERTSGLRTNPSPPYPAGQGKAIAWLEFTGPTDIDELRIEMSDAGWNPLQQLTVPVYIAWSTTAAAGSRPPAPWVGPLNDQQQQMTRTSLQAAHQGGNDGGWMLLFMLAGWSIPGYFILQVALYYRWRDGWRKAALLPLLATVPITAYTLFAFAKGSNLWPLVMLFTVPFAFIYLVALMLARRLSRRATA
jgi:hypothetical protein